MTSWEEAGVPTLRTGPIAGLIIQISLLGLLAVTVGIGATGWAAGLAYGLGLCGLLQRGMRRAGRDMLGPADRVTLARATLVGCVTALVASSGAPVAPLVAIATAALILDAVDGYVARRTGSATPLGARFDMEVDAFLILVLSVHVAGTLGAWVLTIGLMRYAYVVAGWLLPWLRRPTPPRYWAKVVAAIQGIVLTAAASGLFPRWVCVAAVAGALALLVESFGRDVVWLTRHPLPAPRTSAPTLPRVDHEPTVPVGGASHPERP
ncbi:MAG: CDP-alcohol phosphatidyltransferase family protein [Hamadaea sp.]|nr:CDP-alcohol phosphatidyltransferase family protein [Hamadaea sp.]